jgi:AhpD family alkylhydroperoxidase
LGKVVHRQLHNMVLVAAPPASYEGIMKARIDFGEVAPEVYRGMSQLEGTLRKGVLERKLVELVYMRASQINGCAYCLDMHSKDLRAAGETEGRIYTLSAWRETPFFSERERAALAWTEAVTDLTDGVSDAVYEQVRSQFSEKEIVELTAAIGMINAWNRLCIATRAVPGAYTPAAR